MIVSPNCVIAPSLTLVFSCRCFVHVQSQCLLYIHLTMTSHFLDCKRAVSLASTTYDSSRSRQNKTMNRPQLSHRSDAVPFLYACRDHIADPSIITSNSVKWRWPYKGVHRPRFCFIVLDDLLYPTKHRAVPYNSEAQRWPKSGIPCTVLVLMTTMPETRTLLIHWHWWAKPT